MKARSLGVAILLIAPLFLASCFLTLLDLGVDDPAVRDDLRSGRLVFTSNEGLYIARGDGSDARRLMKPSRVGRDAALFQPHLNHEGNRVAFLSMTGIDVRDSSGTGLSLNILDLSGRKPGDWKQVRLEKLLPAGGEERQSVFDVSALSWSRDGSRIAMGLNRDRNGRSDALLVLNASGEPVISYALEGYGLPHTGSISWFPDGHSLALGIETGQDKHGFPIVSVARLSVEGDTKGHLEVIAGGADPSLSSDGDRIAVIDSQKGGWDIVILNLEGSPSDRFVAPAGRALSRPFWSADDRYIYYHSLASTGPLGLIEVSVLRCLDTKGGRVFDLVRLR